LVQIPLTKTLSAGWYVVAIDATARARYPSATLVVAPDQQPVVTAPSSVSVIEGSLLSFEVHASDPDGDVIALTMDSSGLPSGSDARFTQIAGTPEAPQFRFTWTPTFADAGTYTLRFTGTNALTGSAVTQITVVNGSAARAFTTNANRAIRLTSGKPTWCVLIEPIAESFSLSDIDLASIQLVSSGTGSVSEIPAITEKAVVLGDTDRNSVQDIEICYRKEDLRRLLSDVTGRATVPFTLRGDLLTGGQIVVSLRVDVVGGSGFVSAALFPSPLRGQGVLTVASAKAGPVRVQLFSSSGRLVRTLLDETNLAPGYHDFVIDDQSLSSGIYFYRVRGAGGEATGRIAIIR
jgi:hypothetical protein